MTDAPAIDDRTASAIRDAMAAAGAGRTAEAIEIGERALADGGDPVALNAMLGSLRCSAGQFNEGVRHLRVAHEARPTDPVIALNLASGLSALGDNGSARSLITDELVRSDKTFRLARMRGFAAQMLDDFAGAIADYEAVVRANPRDWETWNNLGNSRVSAGDLAGGIAALQQAAELNPRVAQTRLNLALALRDAGELAEAEAQLRSMAEDFPQDPDATDLPFRDAPASGLGQGRSECPRAHARAGPAKRRVADRAGTRAATRLRNIGSHSNVSPDSQARSGQPACISWFGRCLRA